MAAAIAASFAAGGEEAAATTSVPGSLGLPGSRSAERALEEAVATGTLNLSNRRLKHFPRGAARSYDLSDITQAGECTRSGAQPGPSFASPRPPVRFSAAEEAGTPLGCRRSRPAGWHTSAITPSRLKNHQTMNAFLVFLESPAFLAECCDPLSTPPPLLLICILAHLWNGPSSYLVGLFVCFFQLLIVP